MFRIAVRVLVYVGVRAILLDIPVPECRTFNIKGVRAIYLIATPPRKTQRSTQRTQFRKLASRRVFIVITIYLQFTEVSIDLETWTCSKGRRRIGRIKRSSKLLL